MIPKIIHYCWFGRNALPPLAQNCIASWKKYLPDYEIREWNEDNFDVNIIPYTAEAYAMKKYAFVSDYARFYILYKYGGIYFDTDVEVIRSIDDIVARGNFMALENNGKIGLAAQAANPGLGLGCAPGLGLGCAPGLGIMKLLIDQYENKHFVLEEKLKNQETVVHITTNLLLKFGLVPSSDIQEVAGVYIYPSEYFCPINLTSKRLHITPNTRSIHHYAATWTDHKFSLKETIKKFLPERLILEISRLKNKKK